MSEGMADPAADLRADPGFRAQLEGREGWHAQQRAGQIISERFKAAYPDQPAQDDHLAGIAPAQRPQAQDTGPTHDADGRPTSPDGYRFAPHIEAEHQLAGTLREVAFALRMPAHAAVQFGHQIARLAAREPPSEQVLEAQSIGLHDQITAQELARAQAAWRRMEAADPTLAVLLEELGGSTDLELVKLLATLGR